jgi:hypothetical protein
MKKYPTEDVSSAAAGGLQTEKSGPKNISEFITMSVDGTDFMMPFLGPMLYSQKFNDSPFQYEVGVGIISQFIPGCLAHGPQDSRMIFKFFAKHSNHI